MNATLAIVDGSRAGDVFELIAEETIAGREPACDLVLPSDSVSRRHASFVRRDNDWLVQDLGSRNGTYVNGQRVSAPRALADRDEIQLFDVTLVFRARDREGDITHARSRSSAATDDAMRKGLLGETVTEIDLKRLGIAQKDSNAETKLKAVVELTSSLQLGFDLEHLSSRILQSVFRIFPRASRACLFYLDSRTDDVVLGAVLEQEDGVDNPATLRPINHRIPRHVLSVGKAILGVNPANRDPAASDETVFDIDEISLMCVPLIGPSRRALGSIYVDTLQPAGRFTEDDLDVLATVAFLVGQAYEERSVHAARYQAVVDTAADGVITVDAEGTIESVNPAIERLLGYTRAELIGGNVRQLMPELEHEERRDDSQFAFGRETAARRKDGTVLPIRVSGGEFELQGQRHYTRILHDITERKRYETELKQLNRTLEQRVEQRTEHVKLLQDIAVIANEADSIGLAFQAALQRICRHMNWPVGHVFLRSRENPDQFADPGIWAVREAATYRRLIDASRKSVFRSGEGMVGRVIERRKAQWDIDLKEDSEFLRKEALLECGLSASLAFPLFMGQEVVGVVEFFSPHTLAPDAQFLKVMNNVGMQLGRVVERRYLQEEIIDAVWNQQRRFGQEVHDSIGQQLTGIGMTLNSITRKLKAENHPLFERLHELCDMVQQTKEGARNLAKGMFPVDVDAQGLRAALEELAHSTRERYELECAFECEEGLEVRNNNVATHLFRIAQEAVTNAAKHANPTTITVSLSSPGNSLALAVADDGDGGKPIDTSPGIGMRIMQYRANVIGATLEFDSNKHGGATVRCVVGKQAG